LVEIKVMVTFALVEIKVMVTFAVYHLDGRIMSGSKCVHDPAPYSGPSPPDETVVAGGHGP
jgi:hypothetical protein